MVPAVAPAAPSTSSGLAGRFAGILLDQGVELSGLRLQRGRSKETKFRSVLSATARLEQTDSGLPEKVWLGLALQGSGAQAYRLEVDAWRLARSALAHTPAGRILVTAESAFDVARPMLSWAGDRIGERIAGSIAAPPVIFAELRPFAWGDPAPWLVGGPHPALVFEGDPFAWWMDAWPAPEPPPAPFVLADVDLGLAWLDRQADVVW
jgi:hypothetical protein